ncbi:MAG: LytR C-terminal domain-containing protein [Nocardioidaceae bacterium]
MSKDQTAEQTGSGRDVPTRSAAGPSSDKPPRTKPDEPQTRQVSTRQVTNRQVSNRSGAQGAHRGLQQFRHPDLAADKSAELQGAGWKVAATDNWYGAIPESTVYYPDDLSGEAKRLAKTLKIDRVQPAVSPMSFDRLTVIFT